jgi:hypothetical protein
MFVSDWSFCFGWLLALRPSRATSNLVHEDEFHRQEEIYGGSITGGTGTDLLQKFTDGRSKLLRELLSSMQIIKVFTYEIPFLKRVAIIPNDDMGLTS